MHGAVALLLVGAISGQDPSGPSFTSPDQFLVDKTTKIVAIVTVEAIETRWTVIEHGDHIPFLRVRSRVVRPLAGDNLKPGNELVTAHYDYTELLFEPISPPPVIGREHLLFAEPVDDETQEWLARIDVNHFAHPRGSHLLLGTGEDRHIRWQGERYRLQEIARQFLAEGPLPLSLIRDPKRRLRVAEERLTSDSVSDPATFVAALIELFHDQPHFATWYEGLGLLRQAALRPDMAPVVAAALRRELASSNPTKQRCVALLLAELGDSSGRSTLLAMMQEVDEPLDRDPDGRLSLPNRLPYDGSSVTSAAWGLGRLGDRVGLEHPKLHVRLAAADGLVDHGDPDLEALLRPIARELDQEMRTQLGDGTLQAPREPGDYTQRYSPYWVRLHHLLARLGDDRSLARLVDAVRLDWETYPEQEASAFPRLEKARWTSAQFGWPDLHEALATADPDPKNLLTRLVSLYGDRDAWDDPVLKALEQSLIAAGDSDPTSSSEAGNSHDGENADETDVTQESEEARRLVSEQLASTDPEIRARGLAGAGFQRFEDHFDLVLSTALEGAGVEKRAALYGLGFYDRELPLEALQHLVREGDLDARFSGVEIATRSHPERVANETMAFIRDLVREPAADSVRRQRESIIEVLPRILSRFSWAEIPQPLIAALDDENPRVAKLVIQGLALGGNPVVLPALHEVAKREDQVGAVARKAIERLGG